MLLPCVMLAPLSWPTYLLLLVQQGINAQLFLPLLALQIQSRPIRDSSFVVGKEEVYGHSPQETAVSATGAKRNS
jgi:hypothetical protein